MLPADIARCAGKTYVPLAQDFACVHRECARCLRRLTAVAEEVKPPSGLTMWMDVPDGEPCPMRLEAEHA